MTPMIDVVFLLIIFFLVSSHLAKREVRMPLDLPTAATHREDSVLANRTTINLDADGQIQMGASTIAASRVSELLLQHQSEHGGAGAVRIRTDKSVPYGMVEPLLRDIAAAGIVDITFAVREEK
jgi:biopolymer transport protein ExbD